MSDQPSENSVKTFASLGLSDADNVELVKKKAAELLDAMNSISVPNQGQHNRYFAKYGDKK